MTPQESSMLEDLIRNIKETQLTEKDPEAEQLLKQSLVSDPDAVYKLAQTVLIQNLALNQARAQIQQLQQAQQQQQPARSTSFLGGLLGHREPAAPPQQPQYQQVPYQPVPPQYAPPAPYAEAPSAAGSFLRSAATTAAGVAAGALAFEGIESLLHGLGGGSMLGGGGLGGGGMIGGFGSPAPVVDETVINNYYDDPQRSSDFAEHHEHEASFDDRPESHADLKDASYQTDDDDDSRSFDNSQDDSQSENLDSDFTGGDDFV